MSENTVDTDVVEPQGEQSDVDSTDWKAESRKWEARAKANRDASEKLQQLEDAQKSELQRAQDAADAAQVELAATRAEATRLRLAAKYSIGEDHLDLLTGSSDEEIEAKAKKLSTLINKTQRQVPNTWDRPDTGSNTDVEFVSQLFGSRN